MHASPTGPDPGAVRRIVVAHNRYQQRGGEDAVVDDEIRLLRSRGHEVFEYFRDNHDLDRMSAVQAGAQALWSQRSVDEVGALFDRVQPDLLHAHNTFPLISPALYWAAARRRIPVVQTLHNFRLLCPQAMLLRDGAVCEDCVGRPPWRAVRHRCYRDSTSQSAVAAGTLQLHRWLGSWQHKVTRYIALSEFSKAKFIAGGLPGERIAVKPNFVDIEAAPDQQRSGFVFVGRLAPEKGLAVLAAAASGLGIDIQVIGEGPLQTLVADSPALRSVGSLHRAAVFDRLRRSAALLMPSICYESFPLVIVEAFACGLPVIASRLGSLAQLVEDGKTGLLFDPGNAADLRAKLLWASRNPQALAAMGAAARGIYELRFTGAQNYPQLVAIYGDAIGERDRKT